MDDHIYDPAVYFPDPASRKRRVQNHLVHQVLQLSDCSLYQDVTLICSDGSFKLNSFLLAAVFPLFRDILVKVAQYEEEVVISLPNVVGEKIKQFLNDLLDDEDKVVFGEGLRFLFLNQQDIEVHSMNDTKKEELDKEDQIFNVNSQKIEDTEVDFAELDPLDNESSIDKEKDLKLASTQDYVKVETDGVNKFYHNKDICEDIEESEEGSGDDEDQSDGIIDTKKLKFGNEFLCNYDDCPYRSKRPREMRKHLKRHANGLSIRYPKGFKEDKQKCIVEDCEFKAPSLMSINLRRHLESQHSDVSTTCQQCGKTFPSLKKLLRHMYLHELQEISISCDMCGKTLTRANLNRHIKINHMNEDSIECNKCKRTFKAYTFSKHKCFWEQESPKEVCIICGKLVCNLSSHIKDVHSEIKTVQCSVCGKSIKENYIKAHMKTHEEKKACPICGMNVRRLDEHLKYVHTADDKKKFQCQDCGKGFVREAHIEKHRINVHLKTKTRKPYQCRYGCDSTYNHPTNRNRHENTKHGGIFNNSK